MVSSNASRRRSPPRRPSTGEPWGAPRRLRPASPTAAGDRAGSRRRRRRKRKAAAAPGSQGAPQQVWMQGSRGCCWTLANPSPATEAPRVPPTSASPLLQRPMMPPQPLPCPVQQQWGSGRVPKGFHPFSTRSHVPLVAPKQKLPCHHSPNSEEQSAQPQARQRSRSFPSQVGSRGPPPPRHEFNWKHHTSSPAPSRGSPVSDGPGSAHLEGL